MGISCILGSSISETVATTFKGSWAGEVAPWVMVLAAKPDDLSSIPWTYLFGGRGDLILTSCFGYLHV